MFYRLRVIKALSSMFNMLGLGEAHRNDEFLTNFIVDQGTEKFLKAFPETNTLFIFPPSIEALESRLKGRGTETEETLKTRISNAKSEIERGLLKEDPSCLIGYRLVNNDIKKAKEAFVKILESLYSNEL